MFFRYLGRSVDEYPRRGTAALRVLCSASFFLNPLANIGRTIFELGAIGFAPRKKLHCLAVNEPNVLQVQNDAAI